jgi:hypothetical protein
LKFGSRAHVPIHLFSMLPKTLHEGGKGHMASMEKLLASGFPVEITAEEAAQEKAAVKTVQREMDEADEANLLEEEGNLLCITS